LELPTSRASYRHGERTQKAGREALVAVPPLSFVNKDDTSGTGFNLDFRQRESGKVEQNLEKTE